MTSRDDRQTPESEKRNSGQSEPSQRAPTEKPPVPLESLIEAKPRSADTEAADRLGSEAAKAPSPEIEAPDHSYPERDESVIDLVENKRRQKS